MTEKIDTDGEKPEDEEPTGFKINLPFGMGWLRGDGNHLTLLMPVVRWVMIVVTGLYLILRILEEMRQP